MKAQCQWERMRTGVHPACIGLGRPLSWFDHGSATLNWNAQIDIATWRVEER